MEWRTIDSVPKGQVILYYPEVVSPTRGRTHHDWITIDYYGGAPRQATHWMPLPKAPKP
jgi:extradiol dioxygenase family protein